MQRLHPHAIAAVATLLVATAHTPVRAQHVARWQPDTVFVQPGGGERVATLEVGAGWDWDWTSAWAGGTVTGRTDLHLGRWQAFHGHGGFTRAGITPVLRYAPRTWTGGWFVEGGIGVNAISPKYFDGSRRFSTVFNFGDQIAVGRRFGPARDQELSLRFEHLSNAEIKQPNPGQNLLQLRYTRRF